MRPRFDRGVCVFCHRAIEPDEEAVGRGESAAHAACADTALGDEGRWERMAGAFGDTAPPSVEARSTRSAGTAGSRGLGCLVPALLLLLMLGAGRG